MRENTFGKFNEVTLSWLYLTKNGVPKHRNNS